MYDVHVSFVRPPCANARRSGFTPHDGYCQRSFSFSLFCVGTSIKYVRPMFAFMRQAELGWPLCCWHLEHWVFVRAPAVCPVALPPRSTPLWLQHHLKNENARNSGIDWYYIWSFKRNNCRDRPRWWNSVALRALLFTNCQFLSYISR